MSSCYGSEQVIHVMRTSEVLHLVLQLGSTWNRNEKKNKKKSSTKMDCLLNTLAYLFSPFVEVLRLLSLQLELGNSTHVGSWVFMVFRIMWIKIGFWMVFQFVTPWHVYGLSFVVLLFEAYSTFNTVLSLFLMKFKFYDRVLGFINGW